MWSVFFLEFDLAWLKYLITAVTVYITTSDLNLSGFSKVWSKRLKWIYYNWRATDNHDNLDNLELQRTMENWIHKHWVYLPKCLLITAIWLFNTMSSNQGLHIRCHRTQLMEHRLEQQYSTYIIIFYDSNVTCPTKRKFVQSSSRHTC